MSRRGFLGQVCAFCEASFPRYSTTCFQRSTPDLKSFQALRLRTYQRALPSSQQKRLLYAADPAGDQKSASRTQTTSRSSPRNPRQSREDNSVRKSTRTTRTAAPKDSTKSRNSASKKSPSRDKEQRSKGTRAPRTPAPEGSIKSRGPPRQSGPSSSEKSSAQVERPRPAWAVYKDALKKKFPEGWNPRKKISPDAMEGMRALHAQYPEECTRSVLASQFKISEEAVRRVLKAKPRVDPQRRREQWARRHDRIWDQMNEIGLRPKRRTDRLAAADGFETTGPERSA